MSDAASVIAAPALLARIPDVVWRAIGLDFFILWIYQLHEYRALTTAPWMFYAEAFGPAMICLAYVFRPPPRARASGAVEIIVPFLGMLLPMSLQFSDPWAPSVAHVDAITDVLLVLDLALGLAFASLWTSFSIVPEARILRTGGLYRFSRHPIYVLQVLIVFFTALFRASIASALIFLGNSLLQHWRALMEEAKLASVFPEYADFAARTPRYLPRPWMVGRPTRAAGAKTQGA